MPYNPEQLIFIVISVLLFTIMFSYFMYLENNYDTFSNRGVLVLLIVVGVLPIIVSITIGYFITYLIFK